MESQCTHTLMLTRPQRKSNSGGDKIKTHLPPDKTDACHILIKKIESVIKIINSQLRGKTEKTNITSKTESIARYSDITCKSLDNIS